MLVAALLLIAGLRAPAASTLISPPPGQQIASWQTR
jgi:hypothetical protein